MERKILAIRLPLCLFSFTWNLSLAIFLQCGQEGHWSKGPLINSLIFWYGAGYMYSLEFVDCQNSGGSRTQSSGASGSDPCFKVGLFSSFFYFGSIQARFSSVISQDIGRMVRPYFEISEEIEHSFSALQHVQTVILALLVIREPEALERVRMLPPTGVTSAGRRIIGVQVCSWVILYIVSLTKFAVDCPQSGGDGGGPKRSYSSGSRGTKRGRGGGAASSRGKRGGRGGKKKSAFGAADDY